MPRPPLAREQIKKVALELFVKQGVHATGTREIAKLASCSEGAIYRHWKSKEALASGLFEEHLMTVVELMEKELAVDCPKEIAIKNCCEKIYGLYDEKPLVFRFVLMIQHELSINISDDLLLPPDVITNWLRSKGQENAEVFSAALMGIFLQIATDVIYNRLPPPLSSYVDIVTDMAMKIIR